MVAERRDYVALDWVAAEIGDTLTQAAAALDSYLDNNGDITQLRFCLTYIHQVYGTLKMVEFAGAALLAEEMETTAHALLADTVPATARDDALQALKVALARLPIYLQQLQKERVDRPTALLALINDLRALRNDTLITESAIFSPNLVSTEAPGAPLDIPEGELILAAGKLRQMYQMAMLNYLRGHEPRENLNYLAKVCARLSKLAGGLPSEALWKVAIALFEGLLNRSIALTPAIKSLLQQIDNQIREIGDTGAAALRRDPPLGLLKNLLYYIAASTAKTRFISEIKQSYQLATALPEAQVVDVETLAVVNAALANQLKHLADDLDALTADSDNSVLILAEARRAQDTTALLGLNSAQQLLHDVAARLHSHRTDFGDLIDTIRSLAYELVKLPQPAPAKPLFNDSEEAQEQLDKAFDAVLLESRNGLEQAKEAIIEFVANQWRHQCLEEVPSLLSGVRGGLQLAGMDRAAHVLAACENYVQQDLLGNQSVPPWQLLDTLADAIASVDYYLERRAEGSDADVESIIDIAEESVAALGNPTDGRIIDRPEPAPSNVIPFPTVADDGERYDDHAGVEGEHGEADSDDADFTAEIPVLDDTAVATVPMLAAAESLAEKELSAEIEPLTGAEPFAFLAPVIEDEPADDSAEEFVHVSIADNAWTSAEHELETAIPTLEPELEAKPEPEFEDKSADAEQPLTVTITAEPAFAEGEEPDPEIAEIFVEEAGEVLETLDELLPQWQQHPNDAESLAIIRRAFHTLKGSGRMVGATQIGEMAWSVENMLNRVTDGTLRADAARVAVVVDARSLTPGLIAAFEQRLLPDMRTVQPLIERANVLARQQELPAAPIANVVIPTLAPIPTLETATDAVFTPEDIAAAAAETFVAEPLADASSATTLEVALETTASDLTAIGADSQTDDFAAEDQDQPPTVVDEQPAPQLAAVEEATDFEFLDNPVDDTAIPFAAEIDFAADADLTADAAASVEPKLEQEAAMATGIAETPVIDLSQIPADLQEPPLVDDIVVESTSTVWTDTDEDSDAESDRVLLEIFSSEATTHLESLDTFIRNTLERFGFAELDDNLQRALHTLKGSAHMAGVGPIAEIVTPIEHLVKELRAAQLRTDDEVLELLTAASVLLHRGLDQLDTTPFAPIAGADDWSARVAMVYHAKLDHGDDQENSADTDEVYSPAQLGHFLGDAIELISAVADDLALWRADQLPDERHTTLAATIAQVADSAEALNIGAVTALAQAFQSLLRRNAHIARPADDFFDLSALTADHLIDMLDRLAANQETGTDDVLLTMLQDYEPDTLDLTAPDLAQPELVEPPLLENIVALESSVDDDAALDTTGLDMGSFETTSLDATSFETDSIGLESTAAQPFEEAVVELESTLTNLIETPEAPTASHSVVTEFDASFTSDTTAPTDSDGVVSDDFDLALEAAALLDSSDVEADDGLSGESHDDGLVDFDSLEGETVDLDAAFAATPMQSHSSIANDVVNEYLDAFVQPEPMQPVFAAPPLPTLDADSNDSSDEEIDAEILEIFLEEAGDLLEGLDETLHAWNDERGNPRHLDELQRLLHTLKGGARLAGLKNLGNLAHNFETLLINTQQQQRTIDDALLTQVHGYQDQLVRMVDAVKAGGHNADADTEIESDDDFSHDATPPEAESPIEMDAADSAEPAEESPELSEPFEALDDLSGIEGAESGEGVIVPFVRSSNSRSAGEFLATPLGADDVEDLPDMAANALLRRGTGPQEVVKISAQLLEQLVNLAGETSIARSRSEEQVNEFVFALDEMQITVDRLQEQVRRLDSETEAQVISRQEQVENLGMEGFDPLEFDRYSLLQQLSRSLLESASDLIDIKNTLADKSRDMETLLVQQARINTELQEGLMRSRMVPFARMVPRLRRIVRQIAGELGKQVDFLVDNAEGELDRTVLERIVAPLEHMLRNAVDHGIESPTDRIANGKSARGTILLSLAREGSEIALRLSDDGRGIDLNAVRTKAVDRGLMASSANLSDHEVLQFILESGFSTAKQVTQISGRGVGMDVVASEIKQLGGSLDIDSIWGNGTQFTVRLPFTVSVNRALMVNVAGDIYAIPLNSIEGIVRVSPFELEAYYQPEAPLFEYAGQPYQMRYMGALLHSSERPTLEGQTMPLPVLLVRGTDHSVAVQVDGLMGSREIVVKTLGPQFGMVHGLSGATVLGDGSVVVILDLMAMVRADAMHLHRDLALSQDDATPERSRPQLVMVVDDSVTVRKVTSRFLERQGMEVMLAKDGLDAISLLQESDRIPDVMLLDIEMPRMDGFEVASRIRHSSRWQDLPIIMITSRTGEKHRDRAFSLGVNRYLGKPYQEMVLLETIYELTGTTAPL